MYVLCLNRFICKKYIYIYMCVCVLFLFRLNPSYLAPPPPHPHPPQQGLLAAGETASASPAIQRAVQFLLGQQRENGGWGESYLSCVDKAYPEDGTGGESWMDGYACVWDGAVSCRAVLHAQMDDRGALKMGRGRSIVRPPPTFSRNHSHL